MNETAAPQKRPDYRLPHEPTTALGWNRNIQRSHPAEKAAWIWARPRKHNRETRFLRFHLEFESATEKLRFHVTADQRYQLSIDGKSICYGPDRSDLEHWAVAGYEVELTAGKHVIEVIAWHIEDVQMARADGTSPSTATPPMAQISWQGGFLFSVTGERANELDTGMGRWMVTDLTDAVQMSRKRNLGYHDIGPSFSFDLDQWQGEGAAEEAVMVQPPLSESQHGIRRQGWVLHEPNLPEQARNEFSGGTLRVLRKSLEEHPFEPTEVESSELEGWNALLQLGTPQELAPGSEVTVVWDLGYYVCGYPLLSWTGGKGSRVEVEWAESLYEEGNVENVSAISPKGQRDAVANKVWLGFGDVFIAGSNDCEATPGLWWRSGRFLRLRIRTGESPLTMTRMAVLTTIYPWARDCGFRSTDEDWDNLHALLHRGLELGGHDTWVDSPYYEQMTYVGDTALHCLSNYTCYRDDRLTRRALELFDWSRHGSLAGIVAERYPSGWRQESSTYALIWVWMVRDFVMWRRDEVFARQRLRGVRQMLESFLMMRNQAGLLEQTPGWPFVDWAPEWHEGCGPGLHEGDSSIMNLHLVLSFRAAAQIERAIGEVVLADRWENYARETMTALVDRYWDAESNAMADTTGQGASSEHAQALAVLTGLLPPEKEAGCMKALIERKMKVKTSIYFMFYVLESLSRHGEDSALFERLKFWRELRHLGFTSLPEQPEPTRSDCHGWGAHPLYHTYSSIAGIRPAAPGFRAVRIAPLPGPMDHFELVMPHPDGQVRVRFTRKAGEVRIDAELPQGVPGEIVWKGEVRVFEGTAREVFPEGKF